MLFFGETSARTGVSTSQIIEFCNHYHINVYALDLEFKVFYQSNQVGGYLPRNDNICLPAKRPSTIRLTKAI